MKFTRKIKELNYLEPRVFTDTWPENTPLLMFCGSGQYTMVAIQFCELNFQDFKSLEVDSLTNKAETLPFLSGYVGVISYDEYSPHIIADASKKMSRVFRVNSLLIFDNVLKKLFLSSTHNQYSQACKFFQAFDLTEYIEKKSRLTTTLPSSIEIFFDKTITLSPYDTEDHYLKNCKQVIEDIKMGRYYQLNLLRFFKLDPPISKKILFQKMMKSSGPYGVYFDFIDEQIISFSPERFLSFKRHIKDQYSVDTFPIKGTRARKGLPQSDNEEIASLKNSQKDCRELNIIVDLMRNDLNSVSRCGSVNVENPGHVHTFRDVHHLIAHVSSILKEGHTIDTIFKNLCPGGSITGAPKKEVSLAINQLEKRNRGYFMGNCFYLDDSGTFDSSILIRTIVGSIDQDQKNYFEYAAGSGIVINSDPESELHEIQAKCRVITNRG